MWPALAAFVILSLWNGAIGDGPASVTRRLTRDEQRFLNEIRFALTPGEWEAASKMPPHGRLVFAERVLAERSPDCKQKHAEHVATADARFSASGVKGSRTDAGRFWMVWGEPQQIQTEQVEDRFWYGPREDFIPFQYTRMTWTYTDRTKQGEVRVVTFSDVHAKGVFELESDKLLPPHRGSAGVTRR